MEKGKLQFACMYFVVTYTCVIVCTLRIIAEIGIEAEKQKSVKYIIGVPFLPSIVDDYRFFCSCCHNLCFTAISPLRYTIKEKCIAR